MKQERRIKLPPEYLARERARGVILPDSLPVVEAGQDGTLVEPSAGENVPHAAEPRGTGRPPLSLQAGPDREKTPQKRRRHSVLKRLIAVCLLLMLIGGGALGVYLYRATAYDYLWLDLDALPEKSATVLYAQDRETGQWEEYTRLESTQQKIWVPLEEIPLDMRHAFIAIEDKDFYRHHGVSWHRTVFAILNELKKMITGTYFGGENGMKQGASTIDQQLIKNLTRDDEGGGLDGYLRKVREIWRALVLDASYDKDTILEAYLNVISFTGNTAGVEAESIKLFGKSAKDLSLAQCASIAAITKNPYRYDPVTHPENNIARRNLILKEMWEQGYISEEAYNTASAQPLDLDPGIVEVPKTETTSWFTDKVLEDLSQDLAQEYGLDSAETTNLLYNGGLRIYTTVDADLQAQMEQVMQYGGYFQRPGIPGTDYVYDENGKRQTDENGQYLTQAVTEYPQAAMVTLDYDGRLCAVVGGLDEKEVSRSFNRGTGALRQVGSTMKPIGPYALALEKNKIHWSTPFLDAPVRDVQDEKTGEMKPWPANVTRTYTERNILVADALAESVNTVAVRVGDTVGMDAIYRFVTQKQHITSFTREDRDAGPMVLGSSTYGVTPYELAAAYMMFGSGGLYVTPHSYESVQLASGVELLAPEIRTEQAISSDTAWIMNRLLAGVMEGSGTGAGCRVPGEMDSIGKTGTSSDNRDFWFVGLTPYYVTATWYGYDSGASLNVYNGTYAPTRAWRAVMQSAQSGLAAKEFPQDATVVTAEYCTETGGLATGSCPHTKTGYYRQNALPAACQQHAA